MSRSQFFITVSQNEYMQAISQRGAKVPQIPDVNRLVAARLAYSMLHITTLHSVQQRSAGCRGTFAAMRDVSLAIHDVWVRKSIQSDPWQHRETGTVLISPKPDHFRKWQGRQYA